MAAQRYNVRLIYVQPAWFGFDNARYWQANPFISTRDLGRIRRAEVFPGACNLVDSNGNTVVALNLSTRAAAQPVLDVLPFRIFHPLLDGLLVVG